MTFSLQRHPDTPSKLIRGIEVAHEWKSRDTLWLRYFVDCPVDRLFIPDPAKPERMDDLWKTTCFELFLKEPCAAPYCEFNFSPSGRWAAYGFCDFRDGAHDLEVPSDPAIAPLDAGDSYFALEVDVVLPADRIYPTMPAAISAIIVDADENKTYWGYRHPEGDPEFHHEDCFAARLTPPEAA
ncbi:hypothetical protein HFP57_03785 [Parasphingopyxis algicola]|uniref:hypothetical protein n=1 Tax=Parasphingopyxis algicola TaxID=2026624 RepID=UPI0015A4C033|nr:hypothetical protein [Parasphingopyxis algicola]QLC24236.1 hypothetical protein HFP57_03785 [Parasphingopyxis algicola]